MEFNKVIDSRHSVRSYQRKKVSRTLIKKLVISATKAPSACNRQPWIFYCVDSKNKRDKIANLLRKMIGILQKIPSEKKKIAQNPILSDFYYDLGGAQNIIFIYRMKEKEEAGHVQPNDIRSISCAAENLMLEATNIGLGTCWIGTFNGEVPEKELQKILGIDNNMELVASLLIGYPMKGYKPLIRPKKDLKEVIRFI